MILKRALVREPGAQFINCISSQPDRNTININHARIQHATYRKTLSDLGLEVILLPRLHQYPDSCFVEDTAVIHRNKAFICRLAKETRRGEETTIEKILRDYLSVKHAKKPAVIEGGNVIHFQDHLLSGVTNRTNQEGIEQMALWLDVPIDTIIDNNMIHLKSWVTYLGKNTIITTRAFANHPKLEKFHKIIIPDRESYAADTLTIGNTVIMSKGYPQSMKLVQENSFDVVSLDMSEFRKCEGALTCLSLLF